MWRHLNWIVALFSGLVLIHGVAAVPGVVGRAEAQVKGQQSLQQLIDGAKKEGRLKIAGVAGGGRAGGAALGEAFNKRFGLNINFDYNVESTASTTFGQAISEIKQGLPTSFDVINGPIDRSIQLCKAGCQSIDNWQQMLPKGVDPVRASPHPVDGRAFVFATREPGIVYNTKLIREDELPKTTLDLADPKYKGKFYTAAWTTYVAYGPLVYPKDKWLKIMEGWGNNKAATITPSQGVKRMMLGEFAFEAFSNSYYYFQEKRNNNPSGLAFFRDLIPIDQIIHVIPKGARQPNAAKLFLLWATGPEFNDIFEKHSTTGNSNLETSEIGKASMDAIKRFGGKTFKWTDNEKTLDLLTWWATPEGVAYDREVAKALRVQ